MGISWSEPKVVKNKTLIVVNGKFPKDKKASDDIWNLFRVKKEQIKQDGFSVAKNDENVWTIAYFHNITDKSYNTTKNGKDLWSEDFSNKIMKWNKQLKSSSPKKEESVDSFDNLDIVDSPKKSSKKSPVPVKNQKIDVFDTIDKDEDEENEIITDYDVDEDEDEKEFNRLMNQ